MLRQMRTFTRSWVANLLLLLLVGAFAIWGIHDVFRGAGAQNVAKVGGRGITPAQLSRELELTLRAQRQQGQDITQEQAVAQGLHLRLLESLIARAALSNYADQQGISASDAQVAERIRQIPAVINPLSNTFDQTAYAQFLNQYRYTRPEFEHEMRNDITSQMLRHALTLGARAPASYGALLLAYESETRVVSIAEAPASLAGDVPQPDATQIQAFYEDNRARLQMPEYRALTLVFARGADFVARVNVPEERLRAEFETRRASLTQPEKRTYVRLAAQNEQQAQQAAQRLNSGQQPNAVAQALGLQMTRSENETREAVADQAVAAAIFSAPVNEARAVRATLSPWAVVRVEAVTAAVTPSFEAARAQLRQELATDEAGDLMNTAVSAYEDARAGGASPADAGRTAGLAVLQIPATDAEGRDRQGQPIAALANQRDLLGTAFETQEGEASDFTPAGDADVAVAVDGVTPAATRPLEEVRPQLIASWIARERARRLQQIATDVATAVRGGQSFAEAVRAHHLTIAVASRPIDRRTAQQQLPARQLGGEIFSAAVGDVVSDTRADGGAILVAQVERINRVNPSDAPQLVEQARTQMTQSLQNGLDEALTAEIVTRAHPTRNETLIRQTFSANQADSDGGTGNGGGSTQ